MLQPVLQSGHTLGFDLIRQRCDKPDFADELQFVNLADVPTRTVQEFPQRLEPRRQLRVDVRRLAPRKTVTKFLEDGEGERFGATLVASHTSRHCFKKSLLIHDRHLGDTRVALVARS